jgi:uncharacterized repeat protein (TIGR03803 family)
VGTGGTGFTVLHTFSALSNSTNLDGSHSYSDLVLASNTLYGTTSYGGTNNSGVVFSLTLPGVPQLTITRTGTNVIVAWHTNFTGYTLQSNTNLASSGSWTNLSGQFSVTNPVSGPQKYFRLFQ